jgi:hypothetical protein
MTFKIVLSVYSMASTTIIIRCMFQTWNIDYLPEIKFLNMDYAALALH